MDNHAIEAENWHPSQRGFFAGALYDAMKENKDIFLVVGDLGYKVFDKIQDDFPERFINVGASEQAGVGVCVGLALKGKIPFFYSITTFLLRRPYEAIKLYLDGEDIPVKLVGSGRDKDYHIDGPSHDASDAEALLATLPNIVKYWPADKIAARDCVKEMIENNKPSFISLKR